MASESEDEEDLGDADLLASRDTTATVAIAEVTGASPSQPDFNTTSEFNTKSVHKAHSRHQPMLY